MTQIEQLRQAAELQAKLPKGPLKTCSGLPLPETNARGVRWQSNQATAYIDGEDFQEVMVVSQQSVVDFFVAARTLNLPSLLAEMERAERMREALEFYADRNNWEDHGYENGLHWVTDIPACDNGERARAALAQPSGGVK